MRSIFYWMLCFLLVGGIFGQSTSLTAQDQAALPTEIKLPATVGRIAVGGGGRYLVLALPSAKQIGIFDFVEGKIVKYIPADDSEPFVAAGAESFYVVGSEKKTVLRYSFSNFERELETN